MSSRSYWLLGIAVAVQWAISSANAAPPIKVWWAEPYGTAFANGQGPIYSTSQQACAHFDRTSWEDVFTYRYSPALGWCVPLRNGVPLEPEWYAARLAGHVSQKELCIDPLKGSYDILWNRRPGVALEDQCPDSPQATANACPVGNPVSPLTGQKIQTEPPDFESSGPHPLRFQRTYRSDTFHLDSKAGSIHDTWFHNWQRALNVLYANEGTLMARRADGALVRFALNGQRWVQADGQSRDSITAGPNARGIGAWQYYVAATDAVEAYDADGRLLTVTERNGWTTTLKYSTAASAAAPWGQAGVLESVQNQFEVKLTFTYDGANRLIGMTTPDGATIRYGQTEDGSPTVTWPDGAVRRYHYESLPGRLTGITDELGVRYATYQYSNAGSSDPAAGFVTSEEHAGGVDRLAFNYAANATTVTDDSGATRTFDYQMAGKLRQPTGASGNSTIGDPFNAIQYDGSNRVSRTVDRNGGETRYTYDTQGREIQRIESFGAASAKTTTTEWHPTWNLPVKVAAQGRVDYFNYDANGQIIGYAWFPTNDGNGSLGLSATPSGDITASGWTYDANGLITTTIEMVGSAVKGQWSFTYDAQANLSTVTNGAGQTGSAVRYDADGRLLEAVDVTGARIKYAYNSRGWVTDHDIDGLHTRYEYDAIGQITGIVGPYDLVTRYTYDAAHRLIQILDNITVPEPISESSLVSPFVAEGTAAPSSLASISDRLASGWNAVLRSLKDWLGSIISSAQARTGLPNQYAPRIRPGPSAPDQPGSSAATDLDPSLLREKAEPGMYVARYAVKIASDFCEAATNGVKVLFDFSKPPGDCDEDEHRRLQENVNQACDHSGQLRCKENDLKEILMEKIVLSRRCALARTKINDSCFRGGDRKHRDEKNRRWHAFDKCERLLKKFN